MKRLIVNTLFFALALLALSSCVQDVKVTGIVLSSTELSIPEGGDTLLTATLKPEGSTAQIVWSSQNDSIATVDASGLVHGVYGGLTYIYAKADGLTKGCAVRVITEVDSASFDVHHLLLTLDAANKNALIKVNVHPSNAYKPKFMWSSADTSVVYVSNGALEARGIGKTMVKAVLDVNPDICDSCVVEVGNFVKSFKIVPAKSVLWLDEELQLTADIPAAVTHKEIVWTSSDPSRVSVDQTTGKVKALKTGTVTITAQDRYAGAKAEAQVEVRAHVTGVELAASKVELALFQRMQMQASVLPSDAYETGLVWTSSAPEIVNVSQTGEIVGYSEGSAIITVTTVEGGYQATCQVTVLPGSGPIDSVSFPDEKYVVRIGKDIMLVPSVTPGAKIIKIQWETSDSSVATVVEGKVTGVKVGKATITVTITGIDDPTLQNEKVVSANCLVRVTDQDVNETVEDLTEGEEFKDWQ